MNEFPCQLLDHLRQATRREHHALDGHPRLNRLLRPRLDLATYADTLLGLYPAQHCLEEAAISAIRDQGLGYPLRGRANYLREDLTRLGVTPSGGSLPLMPEPRCRWELIGLLYVLEGSRLGAQLLDDRVRLLLGSDTPLRFFGNAAGAEVWPAFRRFVQQASVSRHDEEDRESAAAGMARLAFARFSQSLDTSRSIAAFATP